MTLETPTSLTSLWGYDGSPVILSPDGRDVVMVLSGPEEKPLYRKTLAQAHPSPIPNTVGAILPFFSPDGHWLGFFAEGEIRKLLLSTGVTQTVVALQPASDLVAGNRGATWSEEGTIYFAMSQESPLYEISEDGGDAQPLTSLEDGERSHRWPEALPGGRGVIFTVEQNSDLTFDEADIEVLDLETGVRKTLVEGASFGRYATSGHLLFARSGKLFAVAFDLGSLEVTGAPTVVAESIFHHYPSGSAGYSVSPGGSFVKLPGIEQPRHDLVEVRPDGSVQLLWQPEQEVTSVRASPDGATLALLVESDVWLLERERSLMTRLTSSMNVTGGLTWSPDGSRLAFAAQPRGLSLPNPFMVPASGESEPVRLIADDLSRSPISWSWENQITLSDDRDVFVLPLESDGEVRALLNSDFLERDAEFSPDGRLLAYASNESGDFEVYVRRMKEPVEKRRVSTAGGLAPTWSRDGNELYFLSEGSLMVTRVTQDSGLQTGRPQALLAGPFSRPSFGSRRFYDPLVDPRSFVLLRPRDAPRAPAPVLTLNWLSELRRLAPAR
jgi:serine/threonine-protein kinase